jgi:GTP-binding protein
LIEFVTSAAAPPQFPREGLPEVAFLGRSNVGKSSLVNALTGVRGLARVSSTPGRTRLLNFFRVDSALMLVDLPGYGYAKVPEKMRVSWENLIRAYLERREELAMCVLLVDARHDPMAPDLVLQSYLEQAGLPYVVAATKTDKLGNSERARRAKALAASEFRTARAVHMVSADTRYGIDALWREIREGAAMHRAARTGRS